MSTDDTTCPVGIFRKDINNTVDCVAASIGYQTEIIKFADQNRDVAQPG